MRNRITVILLMGLLTMTAYAQPVKNSTAVLGIPMPEQISKSFPTKPATNIQPLSRLPEQPARKAPRKAVNLSQLGLPIDGIALHNQYEYNTAGILVEASVRTTSCATKVRMVDENHLGITGLVEGGNVEFTVEVNLADGSFSIPDGTVVVNTDYGTVGIYNSDKPGSPLTGHISEEGITIDDVWYDMFIDGDYKGTRWSSDYYFKTTGIVNFNGTMAFTHSVLTSPMDVYIMQEKHKVYVYNFLGMGPAVTVNLKEDNTFTIPTQLIVENDYGEFYTYGVDYGGTGPTVPTLTGTVEGATLTIDGNWSLINDTGTWFDVISGTTITLTDGNEFKIPVIQDVPAIPAQPTIVGLYPYNANLGYGSVMFEMPTTDQDGDLMKEGKLYYILYYYDGVSISPITFTPDLYVNLTDPLTEVPYLFDDAYDFQNRDDYKMVFLNYDFSNYTRIGIQSVYYGGGERNTSDINWFIEPQSPYITAQWVAAEQGYQDQEEVSDITISKVDGITGLFAQAEGSNPPKYYDRGTAVWMYEGNTLTITSEESSISKIELVLGSRTDIELASEEGELNVDDNDDATIATWEGKANEVVFDVPRGLSPSGQARIAGINVYYTTPPIQINGAEYNGAYWATYYNSKNAFVADENTTVYVARLSADKSELQLTEVGDKIINAGEAVILKSTANKITLTRVSYTSVYNFSGNSLRGMDDQSAVPTNQGTIYTLSIENGTLAFRQFVGRMLGAHKAYLAINTTNPAPIRISFGEEATSIHNSQLTIDNSQFKIQNSQFTGYYTIDGRYHTGTPTTRGLYIINGKKVLR